MIFLIFMGLLTEKTAARWTKPNIYTWLEQNSYICYLELHSAHDLRFLTKDEAEHWQCSCGDPLQTQSVCARDSRLKRPFCAKLPDLCMKAYSTIFKPSLKKEEPSLKKTFNRKLLPVAKENEFFTMAPKFQETENFKALQQNDNVVKVEQKKIALPPSPKPTSPPTTVKVLSSTLPIKATTKRTTISPGTVTPKNLLDGEVAAQNRESQGIEIFLNNTEAMNRLMDILIKRIIETNKGTNSTLLEKLGVQQQKEKRTRMIKMLSSREESAPLQRVSFIETMKPEEGNQTQQILFNVTTHSFPEKEPLVLRIHSTVKLSNTTSATTQTSHSSTSVPPLILSASPVTSLPIRISRTRPPRRNRAQFHDKLVRIQKQLLQILGEKFEDFDDEDVINDNDIITVFREHEDDEKTGKNLAFSDDSEETAWSEEVDSKDPFKMTPFDPKVCEDNHPLCEFWSVYRRCRSHAGYMYKFCRKSCGICE